MSAKSKISNLVTLALAPLPNAVKGPLLRKALAISGDEIRYKSGCPGMFGAIANLKASGFHPRSIIDVGANKGLWAQKVALTFPDAQILMIEAQVDLEEDLRNTQRIIGDRANYEVILLGANSVDAVEFHLLGTGSSVFEENTEIPKNVTYIPQKTLDSIANADDFLAPIFLKLDVQGYELEVLKGGQKFLPNVGAILMEVSLLEYNRGAPLMPEVIQTMRDYGFVPYDICGLNRRVSDLALFQVDVIFVPEQSELRAHKRFSMFEPE